MLNSLIEKYRSACISEEKARYARKKKLEDARQEVIAAEKQLSEKSKVYASLLAEKENCSQSVSWLEMIIEPMVKALAEMKGLKYKIIGPRGIGCRVYVSLYRDDKKSLCEQDYLSIVLQPGNLDPDGEIEIFYETGEVTSKFARGSLGALNGLNNEVAILPDTLEEILDLFELVRPFETGGKQMAVVKPYTAYVNELGQVLMDFGNTNFKHSYPYTTKHLVVLSTGESMGGLPLVELWSKMNAEVKSRRAKQFELFICHKGNGLTFSNKLEEENGDYKHIAHLSDQGKLTWYVPYGYTPAQAAMKIREMADIKANQYDAWLQSLPENDRKMELMRHLTDQQFLAMTIGEW